MPCEPCDGDCFNCKYDDCILTDTELRRAMRKKRVTKQRKVQKNRIGKLKGEFKAEYILTPLPHSPESQRTWSVDEDES